MRILRNYILKECIVPFLISLSVLTCVFLLGYLPQLADKVINKGVSLATISKVFIYYVPLLLGYTLPIACITTVILTFGRLSADNEILAMRASGIYISRILAPIILVGVIFSLFLLILNDRIIPHAYHEQRRLLKETSTDNPTALLEAGTFINAFQGYIIFIYRIENNRMYGVRIYQPQPEGMPTRTVIAQEGEFAAAPSADRIKLKLINGTSDEVDFKNPGNFYKLRFDTTFITLDMSKNKKRIEKKPKGMSLAELEAKMAEYKKMGIDDAPLLTEYHRKLAWSFTPLIFMLMGFPVAVITHRREKTANIVYALIFAAPYFLLSLGCQALATQGVAPPDLIMWAPNALGGLIALILNIRLCVS